jgi:drug/metabolite transporter (DMT)-like permease
MSKLSLPRNPVISLVLAMFIWGSSFTVIKVAVATYDPFLVAFSRLCIATGVFFLLRKHLGPVNYRKGDWKPLLLMAVFEPFLYFSLENHALRLTSSAAAATIIALLPVSVAIAAHAILNEKQGMRLWMGVLIALAGTLILTWSGEVTVHAPMPLLGNTLEFLAMLSAVGYTLMVKYLTIRYSALFLTALQSLIGSLLFLPFMLSPAVRDGGEFSWPAILAILYLGGIVSVFAYLLFNHALSRLPASRVAVFSSLIPVFAAFFGWLILGEAINLLQGGAMALVLVGVLYSQGGNSLPGRQDSRWVKSD